MSRSRSRTPEPQFEGNKLPSQWISTFNNYTDADIDKFRGWCQRKTTYSIVGREVGKQGTPHLQGFHQNSRNLSFNAFKKSFPSVHVKPAPVDNGASEYAEKDGDVCIRHGEYEEKGQGRRMDLVAVAKLAEDGKSLAEIAKDAPTALIQYPAGLARLCALNERARDRSIPKRCVCLYGPTGTGKTRRVWDHCDTLGVVPYLWENGMPTWWDGYSGQKHVIMDEYRSQLPMSYLLRLMDRYPMRVQYKGGSCQFVADYLYFTSSKHPRDWYSDSEQDKIDQLLRRFDAIYEISSCDALCMW